MKLLSSALCLLCLLGTALGEEPAPKPTTPEEQRAAAVRTAFAAKDEQARAALLAAPGPGPWTVAEALRRERALDAALWLAEGLGKEEAGALQAYLEGLRDAAFDERAWAVLAQAKQHARARKREDALALLLEFAPDPKTVIGIEILYGRGEVLIGLGRLRACALRMEEAGRAAERIGWRRRAQRTLHKAGQALWALNAYAACEPLFSQARAHAHALGLTAEEGISCYMLGLVLDTLGRSLEALPILERAVALGREAQNPSVEGMGLDGLGALYERRGDSYTALEYRKEALAMALRGSNAFARMVSRSNLSVTLLALGEGAQAREHLEKAIEEARAQKDLRFEAVAQANLGAAFSQMGRMADAFRHLDIALELARKTGNVAAQAKALSSKGSAYFHLADYAPAKRNYEEALKLAEGLQDPAMAAEQLQNLGNIAQREGDTPKGRELYRRALDLREKLGDQRQVLRLKESLASWDAEAGNDAAAIPQFREILAAQVELGDPVGAVFTRINLADSLSAVGQTDEGLAEARTARDAAEELGDRYALLHAYLVLSRACLHANRLDEAMDAARTGTTTLGAYAAGQAEEQAATIRERFLTLLEIGATAAWLERDMDAMLAFLEAGRAGSLVEVLGGRGRLVDAVVPPALAARERAARQREGRAWEALSIAKKRRRLKPLRAAREELQAARSELQGVMESIEREARSAAGLVFPRIATLDEVQADLAAGEALVLYALFKGPACALVITRDEARPVALGDAETIRAAWRAIDWESREDDPTRAMARLRSLLVEALVLPTGIRRVLVSPAGEIAYVPFAALDPARTYTLVPSATTRRYLATEQAGPEAPVLALGDPQYGTARSSAAGLTRAYGATGLTPLPQTRGEVETIGSVRLLGADATEKQLAGALASKPRWRALHLACHGLLDTEQPRFSSLAITPSGSDDGFLTAAEIVGLPVRADLVCMSACETGRGRVFRAEGVLGLTRAFMFAGAPRVLCSLWKVDDEATRALMVKFYELWNPQAGKGLAAAEALRQAQAHVRAQKKWQHPYYWGAWVLWGRAD